VKTALDTARAYLDKLPPAISGAGGHAATFAAACWTVRLGLSDIDALALLLEYNRRCQPPWKETELAHKLRDARSKAGGQVRTFAKPKPAVRLVWKLERKAARAAEPLTKQAPTPTSAEQARPDPTAGLPPDCAPWLHVAQQVLADEFNGCGPSTRESLTIGLRRITHPLCRQALERLTACGLNTQQAKGPLRGFAPGNAFKKPHK
jgi:hypothetical protein